MTALHLVRLPLNVRALTAWALARGYLSTPPGDGRGRPGDAELGYALHAALASSFGEQSPRPFDVPLSARHGRPGTASPAGAVDLFGYAGAPIEALRTLAALAEDADLRAMIHWDRAQSRPMPDHWPVGLRLRFDLRACPVRRIMKPFETRGRPGLPAVVFQARAEVDAYQVAAARAAEDGRPLPQRDRTYIEWLAERLAAGRGSGPIVQLLADSVRVEAYRSVRMLRRPAGKAGRRSARWLTRPDVRFTGLLDVVDPKAFSALLASGVGRHCGFGFGMLLLKPV